MAAKFSEAESARLEDQARVLLSCGYAVDELTVLRVREPGAVTFNPPEVVPLSALRGGICDAD